MPIPKTSKLHKLWSRANAGNVDAMVELLALVASDSEAAKLVEGFRRGVTGDQSVIAGQSRPDTPATWSKLASSNKVGGKPASAGLPSLGRRR